MKKLFILLISLFVTIIVHAQKKDKIVKTPIAATVVKDTTSKDKDTTANATGAPAPEDQFYIVLSDSEAKGFYAVLNNRDADQDLFIQVLAIFKKRLQKIPSAVPKK